MKFQKILLSFFLGFLFLFFSCVSNKTSDLQSASSQNIIQTKDFPADENHVKLLGRSIFINDNLIMAYSSTGAEFLIKAKHLEVTFAGDGNEARVVVFVNGERKLDEMIRKSVEVFTVFDESEVVEGEVQILKVSEATSSLAGITKITTDIDGEISPSPVRDLKIEFIGDSITCGYGVDDLNMSNHFKVSTEDNTKTYAYKAAKALNADYSMVSISGWGIISGYSGDGSKHPESQLPKIYDRMAFSHGRAIEGVNPGAVKWDFSIFKPDVVVVNLGTNDNSYTKGKSDRIEDFTNSYVEFIKAIRSKNPQAYIICSLGIMGQDLFDAVNNAVIEYKNQTGDENICSLKFANQLMSDGIAADWHPSEKTHTKAAKLLVEKIKEIR